MTDNILAGWQFDRLCSLHYEVLYVGGSAPHAMECHKDLIKEITLTVSKTTHEHNLNHNIVIAILESSPIINSTTMLSSTCYYFDLLK